MISTRFQWFSIVSVLFLALNCALRAGESKASKHTYFRWLDAYLTGIEREVPSIVESAERAARAYVEGGYDIRIFADEGTTAEFCHRIGGLSSMRPEPRGRRQSGDRSIVLVCVRADRWNSCRNKIRELEAEPNVVQIIFDDGPFPWREREGIVRADLVRFLSPVPRNEGNWRDEWSVGRSPTEPTRMLVELWVWTGEFVAACTRLGKLPMIWQLGEGHTADGEAMFEKKRPAPVAVGVLGRAYLRALHTHLSCLIREEEAKIDQAVTMLRAAKSEGKETYCFAAVPALLAEQVETRQGPHGLTQVNDKPSSVKAGLTWSQGDVVLGMGVDRPLCGDPFGTWADDARQAGARLIWCYSSSRESAPDGVESGPPSLTPENDLVIDERWPVGDAVVSLPDFDRKILPVSGVISHALLWAIVDAAYVAR